MQGDHYAGLIADWYDDWLSARRDDIDFYSSYFERFSGTVLELACGTGRILLPIARGGVDIQGLDGSEDMLRVLRTKASEHGLDGLRVHHQPMEDFSLGTAFDAIFVAGGSFQLLTQPGDAMRSLNCIREHLKDDGFFLLDIFIPWDAIQRQESSTYQVTRDAERSNGERSMVFERFEVDLERQLKLGTFRYEFYDQKRLASCITDDLVIRWYWKDEFRNLLSQAGFSNVQLLTESPMYKEGHSFVFKASE